MARTKVSTTAAIVPASPGVITPAARAEGDRLHPGGDVGGPGNHRTFFNFWWPGANRPGDVPAQSRRGFFAAKDIAEAGFVFDMLGISEALY
jgi:hypothetical protein